MKKAIDGKGYPIMLAPRSDRHLPSMTAVPLYPTFVQVICFAFAVILLSGCASWTYKIFGEQWVYLPGTEETAVTIWFVVEDDQKRPIIQLPTELYNASVDGLPPDVEAVRHGYFVWEQNREWVFKYTTGGPSIIDITFIADVSGSIYAFFKDDPNLTLLKSNLASFPIRLGPDYFRYYLRTFAGEYSPVMPMTPNIVSALSDRRARERHENYTALYDTVYDTIDARVKWAKENRISQPAIFVVLSDGADNRSRQKLVNVVNQIEATRTMVFTIGMGELKQQTDLDAKDGLYALKQIGQYGGFYYVESPEQLQEIFSRIQNSVRFLYPITYFYGKRQPGFHDLDITISSPKGNLVLETYFEHGRDKSLDQEKPPRP